MFLKSIELLQKSKLSLRQVAYARVLLRGREKRILFSEDREELHEKIRWGFRHTGHIIEFAPLEPERFHEFDWIVPLTVNGLRNTAEIRDRLPSNSLPVPSLKAIDLCDDKSEFNKAFEAGPFAELIPRTGSGLRYPYLVKKVVDENSAHCYIVRNEQDERKYHEELASPDYFCQELVVGKKEYASHVVVREGEIVADLTVVYHFRDGVIVKGKDKFIATTVEPTPFRELFTKVLREIEFEGLCCLNYKIKDGMPFLFEINPRFGASLARFVPTMLHQMIARGIS